ncbi:MAG: DUF5106 domain-containing protein [Alphaproteobacteria bacterium]|nr:DUF5106 domain-containing protein [Alphaproteobacteria bacterium]
MKFINVFLFILVSNYCLAQNAPIASGHDIKVSIPSLANKRVFLGTYYEKKLIVQDSLELDQQGNGALKGKNSYVEGVYFIVTPALTKLEDFLIGSDQDFSILADTIPNVPQIVLGSLDNDLFKNYNDYIKERTQNISNLERAFTEAGLFPDSNARRQKLSIEYQQIDKDIKMYREKICIENPESFLARLFNVMKRPDVPTTLPLVNGKLDSAYPYRYVKEHFWDDTYFNDPSLLHTPFFEDKLDEYYNKIVSPDPDSIIKEIRYMMAFARSNKEMYSFFLNRFTNKYWVPKYLGQDKVFVFLYENYFSKGDTTLVTPESRKNVRENYFKLFGNYVGTTAAPIVLTDTAGKKFSLYDIKNDLIFVIFWDPTCGHCRTQVPRADSFYKALWKEKGVAILTMNMNRNNDLKIWKEFINEHKLYDWYNGYEPDIDEQAEAQKGRNIRQSYAISSTPTFFLIDKNKKIIGKSLDFEQYTDLINLKYRQYQEESKKKK